VERGGARVADPASLQAAQRSSALVLEPPHVGQACSVQWVPPCWGSFQHGNPCLGRYPHTSSAAAATTSVWSWSGVRPMSVHISHASSNDAFWLPHVTQRCCRQNGLESVGRSGHSRPNCVVYPQLRVLHSAHAWSSPGFASPHSGHACCRHSDVPSSGGCWHRPSVAVVGVYLHVPRGFGCSVPTDVRAHFSHTAVRVALTRPQSGHVCGAQYPPSVVGLFRHAVVPGDVYGQVPRVVVGLRWTCA